jgi:hypothetical protein
MTDDECFVTMSTPVSNHGERGYITKQCETRGNDLIKKRGHFSGLSDAPGNNPIRQHRGREFLRAAREPCLRLPPNALSPKNYQNLLLRSCSRHSAILTFTWGGKECKCGLGSVAKMGFAEAGAEADHCRKLISQGVDPAETRRTSPDRRYIRKRYTQPMLPFMRLRRIQVIIPKTQSQQRAQRCIFNGTRFC